MCERCNLRRISDGGRVLSYQLRLIPLCQTATHTHGDTKSCSVTKHTVTHTPRMMDTLTTHTHIYISVTPSSFPPRLIGLPDPSFTNTHVSTFRPHADGQTLDVKTLNTTNVPIMTDLCFLFLLFLQPHASSEQKQGNQTETDPERQIDNLHIKTRSLVCGVW